MEIIAKTEALRLTLYHLAQAFGVDDAEKIELKTKDKVLWVYVYRNGKTDAGWEYPTGKGASERAVLWDLPSRKRRLTRAVVCRLTAP